MTAMLIQARREQARGRLPAAFINRACLWWRVRAQHMPGNSVGRGAFY